MACHSRITTEVQHRRERDVQLDTHRGADRSRRARHITNVVASPNMAQDGLGFVVTGGVFWRSSDVGLTWTILELDVTPSDFTVAAGDRSI